MNKKILTFISIIIVGVVVLSAGYVFYKRSPKPAPAPVVTEQQENIYQGGIEKADAEIQKNPRQIFGYLDKAEYLRQMGKESDALRVLEDAYRIQPDWKNTPDFMIVEAHVYSQTDPTKAIERYEKLIELDPLNQGLYAEYISFLKRSNQPRQKIVDWYERVMAKMPETYLRAEYQQFLSEAGK